MPTRLVTYSNTPDCEIQLKIGHKFLSTSSAVAIVNTNKGSRTGSSGVETVKGNLKIHQISSGRALKEPRDSNSQGVGLCSADEGPDKNCITNIA